MRDARQAARAAADRRSLYDLGPAGLARLAAEAGEPAYRARQLGRQLDRRNADPAAMTDLPARFRAFLGERFAGLGLQSHQVGDDGWTHKFLFGLAGGDSVESVLMFYPPSDSLARLLVPLRAPGSGGHAAHVNLIAYNPTPGLGLETPSRSAVRRFRDIVAAHGLPVSVRPNRGVGIDAACGQLRTAPGRPGRGVGPLVERRAGEEVAR